jgi:hypothetical protein
MREAQQTPGAPVKAVQFFGGRNGNGHDVQEGFTFAGVKTLILPPVPCVVHGEIIPAFPRIFQGDIPLFRHLYKYPGYLRQALNDLSAFVVEYMPGARQIVTVLLVDIQNKFIGQGSVQSEGNAAGKTAFKGMKTGRQEFVRTFRIFVFRAKVANKPLP